MWKTVKNPFKPNLLPWFTLGAGAVGFLLKLWLELGGIDDKGLYISGHPAATLLMILTAIALAVVLLCVLPLKRSPSYKKLFPKSTLAFLGCVVGGAGILATDIAEIIQRVDLLTVLSLVVGLLAAASLLYAGFCRYRGIRPGFLYRCIVAGYFMLHLVSQYRFWSAEPQVLLYFFPLLASVFLMISAYLRATMDGGLEARRWYVFTNQAALLFCCLSVVGQSGLFYLTMGLWTATELCSLKEARRRKALQTGMHLPAAVGYCMAALEASGYKAYAVGGCVRDALLGKKPHDYDLCTDAKPEAIAEIFSEHQLVRNGEKHGTIGVVIDGEVFEITTFRTEGGYADSRHPGWVEFVPTVEEDLARRDFTVNAMAYAPGTGYIDPWGGQADLKGQVLRAVGDPQLRFDEDALRILRGVRFAVRFGLTPEPQTENAMFSCAGLMDKLARERVYDELCKLLPLVSAEDLQRYAPVLTQAIPELGDCVGFQQHSPHHAYDVYTHTAHVVEATEASLPLRWAALLHDIGKPATFQTDEDGRGHFYGHAQVSADLADAILLRLKAPNALREQVVTLISHHMDLIEPDKKLLRRRMSKLGEENLTLLLALQKADFCSKGVAGDHADFDRVEALLAEIRQEDACLSVKDLAINGRDLLEIGYTPGPHIGKVLAEILELVQDERLENQRQTLLDAAAERKEDSL